MKSATRRRGPDVGSRRQAYAAQFLEFFYPVHYRLGRALEDVMGRGRLTRKQVAVLWAIHSEGEGRRSLPRKRIEQLIKAWFEVTSSAVTKTVRPMATELGLIRLLEDPRSGREKQVLLTTAGERLIDEMIAAARNFLHDVSAHLGDEQMQAGIEFLRKATEGIDRILRDGPSWSRR